MLPEMSSARAMSTPSPWITSRACTVWGRARPRTNRLSAAMRKMFCRGRRRMRQVRTGTCAAARLAKRRPAGRCRALLRRCHQKMAGTMSSKLNSQGEAN